MQLELKKVKVVASMSEETTCFSAELHMDGRKVAEVSNEGRGGAHRLFFADRQDRDRFEALAASLPPEVVTDYPHPRTNESPWSRPVDTETVINSLLDKSLAAKELGKMFKSRLVFMFEDKLCQSGKLSPDYLAQLATRPEVQAQQARALGATEFLNFMEPDAAVRLYLKQTTAGYYDIDAALEAVQSQDADGHRDRDLGPRG